MTRISQSWDKMAEETDTKKWLLPLKRIVHRDGDKNRTIFGYIEKEDENYMYVVREKDGRRFRFNHSAIVRIEDVEQNGGEP